MTETIVYERIKASKLETYLDDVLTVLGGVDRTKKGDCFREYQMPEEGWVILLLHDPKYTQRNKQRTGKEVTGSAMLLGFKQDAFYSKVYNALLEVQKYKF